MSDSSVKISVVMPSYNQAQYLDEAIGSVLNQNPSVFELLVLDGGSTDGSVAVIERYQERLAFSRSHPDKGQSDAIREGFERARGDVLCWLNSDDLYLPGTIAAVTKAFQTHVQAEVVSGYLYYINEHSLITDSPQVLTGNHLLARLGVININQPATFFKKELFERVGGIDSSLHCAMDMDLWCRFHLASAMWISLPSYLAAFRKHPAAKGGRGAWWDQYQDEKQRVRKRYPSIYGSALRSKLGLGLYRSMQIATGRQLRATALSHRLRGKSIAEAGT